MGKMSTIPAETLLHCLNTAVQEHADKIAEIVEEKGVYIRSVTNDRFEVITPRFVLASFGLSTLPGCCGALVSHWASINESFRRKGLGVIMLMVRMSAARRLKYGQMLATVLATNLPEQTLLLQNGWLRVGEFRNPRTNSLIQTFLVNL